MHRLPLAFALALALAQGCAPSHRMVRDGNVYFERCYGADFNPKVTLEEREACWNAWLAHYTRHQAAHRIDYAMRRVEALQSFEPSPGLPDLPGPAQELIELDPKDTEVTLVGPRAGAEVATTVASGEEPAPHGCVATCDAQLATCQAACERESEGCPAYCEREKTICAGGCY